MFDESPFTGACAFALWEVIVMLAGTLALGVLLGYLIWGWTKRKLLLAQMRVKELEIEVGELDAEVGQLRIIEQKQRVRAASWASNAITGRSSPVEEPMEKEATPVTEQPDVFPMAEPGEESFTAISNPEQIHQADAEEVLTEKELSIASEVMGVEVELNDLEIIEGIGPMISDILVRSGITSWEKLGGTSKNILRVILDEAGPQYRVHKPKTWPKQARMAVDGEWKKLKAYQESLIDGK